jgi:hypothetical protein
MYIVVILAFSLPYCGRYVWISSCGCLDFCAFDVEVYGASICGVVRNRRAHRSSVYFAYVYRKCDISLYFSCVCLFWLFVLVPLYPVYSRMRVLYLIYVVHK